jgi:hypothetical protein
VLAEGIRFMMVPVDNFRLGSAAIIKRGNASFFVASGFYDLLFLGHKNILRKSI